MVADELPQNHNHDNARRKIIKNSRQDEGHQGNTPQQCALAVCLHCGADPVETAVLVDNFYNCHGAHQEEKRGGCAAKVLFDGRSHAVDKGLSCKVGEITLGADHKKRPASYEHQ